MYRVWTGSSLVIQPHFVTFDTCHIDNANTDDGFPVHCGVSFTSRLVRKARAANTRLVGPDYL